jgi:hypothetical protein
LETNSFHSAGFGGTSNNLIRIEDINASQFILTGIFLVCIHLIIVNFAGMKNGLSHITVILASLLFFHSSIFAQSTTKNHSSPLYQIGLLSPKTGGAYLIKSTPTLSALVLLSPDCPMSVNYTKTLNDMQQQFGNSIQVMGILPGNTYKDATVFNFAEEYHLRFPLYVDKKMHLSRQLKGEVTPEVFLLDAQGQLVYRGAIDNWLAGIGQKRQKPTEHYLLDAINQSLLGLAVSIPYVKAQGCILNDY